MTKKQILSCIAFVLVVCLVLVGLTDIFEMDHISYARRFNSYRCFEEDTVDGVYLGTSGVARYWISAKAYDEYGMTVYPLAIDAMPVWMYSIMVDEALAYQDPQLLILDTRPFLQGHTTKIVDVTGRRVLDSMEFFSVNRMKAALKTMEIMHSLDDTLPTFDISYIFSFAKFHTKWSNKDFSLDTQYDKQKQEYGGYHPHPTLSIKSNPKNPVKYSEDHYEPLNPLSEESLYEVLEHTKELGVQVLFVDSPKLLSKKEWGRMNTIRKILQEEGATFISYNFPDFVEQLNVHIDPKTDYYDNAHVNYYGAEKFTASLAAYVDEHYNLPDRRNDEAVRKDWDGVYDRIKKAIAKYEAKYQDTKPQETTSSGG